MTLTITKDPRRRRGGGALIRLPAGTAGASRVVVRKDEGALHLGPHGWQGAEHAFGPYDVVEEQGGPALRVGPEIVNRIDPYDPIEVSLPELGLSERLAWPGEIAPAPDAFEGGGVSVAPGEAPETSGLMRSGERREEAIPTPQPERETAGPAKPPEPGPAKPPKPGSPAQDPDRGADVDPPPTPEPQRPRLPLYAALALLLLIAAGAAWWLLAPTAPDETAIVPTPPPEEPVEPEETEAAWTCDEPAVLALLRDPETEPGAVRDAAEVCAAGDAQELQVRLMERLASVEDPQGLTWFARQYDPAARPDDSPFAADPQIAAGYYARAVEAGGEEAAAGLDALCASLREDGGPIARITVQKHCE